MAVDRHPEPSDDEEAAQQHTGCASVENHAQSGPLGAGTDVAVESAGIVLVRSDPRDVVGAIRLSRASYRKMVQNLVWATGYNVVAIPVAAGVLAPWGIDLSMAVGAIAMSLSTVIVATNAQLLRRLRLRPDRVVLGP